MSESGITQVGREAGASERVRGQGQGSEHSGKGPEADATMFSWAVYLWEHLYWVKATLPWPTIDF